jgi:hypothetical protein
MWYTMSRLWPNTEVLNLVWGASRTRLLKTLNWDVAYGLPCVKLAEWSQNTCALPISAGRVMMKKILITKSM